MDSLHISVEPILRSRRTSRRGRMLPTPTLSSSPGANKALSSFKVAVRALKFINRAQTSNTVSFGVKPFPPQKKEAFRPSLVNDDILERNIDFNNPEDQKVVTSILIVRPQRRFEEEVTFLQRAFRDLEAFKGLQNQMDEISFRKIFRALRIETFKAGDKIVNYGDFGKDFYIIIKGSVYVLVRSNEKGFNRKISKKSKSKNFDSEEDGNNDILDDYLIGDASESEKKLITEKLNPGFLVVNELFKGQSFGEIALNSSGDRKRTATILCRENTYVGVLGYEDYCNILTSIKHKKVIENISFLQTIDIFKKWKALELQPLARNLKETKYSRNQAIFREGDIPDRIYFVKKGEIELQKNIDKDRESIEDSFFLKKQEAPNCYKSRPRHLPKSMRLTILVKGGYFGEWNLSNISQEYTAIVYSTEVILLSITREAFKSLIKDKTDFQDFEKNLQEKKIWRKSFLSKIVDSRENSIEKSFVLENSQTKLKKDDLNFNEYYGSEALPNYFLQNLSPCKGPQGKVLTSLAVGKKPHHSTGRIQTNEKSSSVSITLDNNIMKQGFPHKNKCKELSPSISSKIFSPSFMKKLSDEHPIYSRQRRRLANAPLKNRGETSSSKRTLSRTEQNDKNPYFEKIMTEPSRIYQFEPSNYSSSFFLSNNNTKVNTPAISSKDRKINVCQDEEKLEAQSMKFKIMKLKLDKIYQNKELSWNGLKTLSYRSPLNNEELLPQRNYEISTNINKPDIKKFRQTWSQLQNKGTPKTLIIPQQRGSFSFQSKKIIKFNGSHSHRE